MNPNASTPQCEPKPALDHQAIAQLAWQIWLTEGRQSGRDREYWFRAEQQLLAASRPPKEPANHAGVKRKTRPVTAKNSARRPAAV